MLKALLTLIITALLAVPNPSYEKIDDVLNTKKYQGLLTTSEVAEMIENSDIEESLKVSFINKLKGEDKDDKAEKNEQTKTPDTPKVEPVKKLPANKYLQAKKYYSQKTNYPQGCELIALVNSMLRLGLDPDVSHFNVWYFINEDFTSRNGKRFGPDPEEAYAGNPASYGGYYCFENVSITSGNHYLKDHKSSYRLKNITGADKEEIKSYIADGFPVVFWALLNFDVTPRYGAQNGWYIKGTNEFYNPYINLHCMTIVGYDDKKGFNICDSLSSSEYWVSYDKFMKSSEALGSRMITYYKQ
jgi:hypothetical protein